MPDPSERPADKSKIARPGNEYPPCVDTPMSERVALDRESMFYSYQNTVESSYVGDIRLYALKIGEYCKKKARTYDPTKKLYKEFEVRYAAPHLAFSDNKPSGGTGTAEELPIKDRITLPVISYHMTDMAYDKERAIDPAVRFNYKQKTEPNNQDVISRMALVTPAPIPMKYGYQVDVWTELREDYFQIITAFQSDFNPYSYLYDLHDYVDDTQKSFYKPYARMNLLSYSDSSNFIPGTDRRVIRGILKLEVEGWLSVVPSEVPYVQVITGINIIGLD